MTADQASPLVLNPAPRRSSLGLVLRLLLAFVLTAGVLLYAYVRCLIIGMLIGRPEILYSILLIAGLVLVIRLTYGLAHSFSNPGTSWVIGLAVAASWIGTLFGLIYTQTGTLLQREWVAVLLIPATLWVPWLAWMYCWSMSGGVRFGILAILLLIAPVFAFALKPEGLTGDAKINFAWRWPEAPPAAPNLAAENLGRSKVDFPQQATEEDYPQYLGQRRLGVVAGAHLSKDWRSTPPRLVWKKPVGLGWSGFAVVGDFAITQEQRGPQECVVCYRVSDGSQVWLHADETRFNSGMGGDGPRATPTIHEGNVYAVGATGMLNCLEGATGRRLWSVDILKDNEAENLVHGVCGSPLVVDDRVLVCPTGSNGHSLVAYDRKTGHRLWQAGKDQASYGSPLLVDVDGIRQVLVSNAPGVASYLPATGELLWQVEWSNRERINCAQPHVNVAGPNTVLLTTGYDKGSVLFRLERSSDGTWTPKVEWESRHMQTKFTSAVEHQGYLYGLDNGILSCLEVATGNRKWKDGRYQHGQVLLAGDLLIVQAENGSVVLVEPNPQELRELGRIPALRGKTWNHPALAGKYLLVRNDQEAACFELSMADDATKKGAE